MPKHTIAVGCDHAGLELKNQIVKTLKSSGREVKDFGVHSPESVDYPDIGSQVAKAVSTGACGKGILVCGAGIGMSIVANKYPGIRAALCHNAYTARMSRQHNDANILVLGARVIGSDVALETVKTWLNTEFSGQARHANRLNKITSIEQEFSGKK